MDFELKAMTLPRAAAEKCDQLVVLVTKEFVAGSDVLGQLIAQAVKGRDLDPSPGKALALYRHPGVAARRVLFVGIGSGNERSVRQALAAQAGVFRTPGVKRLVLCFANDAAAAAVAAAVHGAAQARYVYTHTKPKAEVSALAQIVIGVAQPKAAKAAFDTACAVAQGVELAREWGNRPANHATPRKLADAAKALAKNPGMECRALGPAEVQRLRMGAFMAVAQGSEEPLRFIELKYNGAPRTQAPVVIVGKGITFDTGGISLKPAPDMDEMKFDMCGAASVLGVFRALTQLRPAINVVGLIPACENMPDGRSVKPGDVVTSMSGQTIEVLNTDAEGRLVLCDALTYAARHQPAAIVDIATLTGACVVALGGVRAALYATDDVLGTALLQAGEASGDLAWRMPLDEEYAEGLKSNFADFGNIAGRAAGSVTAAKFLQAFVGDTPWAHLDIAGVAWKSGAAKGATGRPVALLVHWLLQHAQTGASAAAPRKRPSKQRRA